MLGIVVDQQDRPIASFLWPGNTAYVITLLPLVARLRSRFGVERACIVADRGMISVATIAGLEAQKIDYILGVRERSSKEVRETVLHDDSRLPSFSFRPVLAPIRAGSLPDWGILGMSVASWGWKRRTCAMADG